MFHILNAGVAVKECDFYISVFLYLRVSQVYITSLLKVFCFHLPLKRIFKYLVVYPYIFVENFEYVQAIYKCKLLLTLLQLIYLQAKPVSCCTSDIQKLTARGSFMANLVTFFFLVKCIAHKLMYCGTLIMCHCVTLFREFAFTFH